MEQSTPLWSAVNLSIALYLLQHPATLDEVAEACHLSPAEAQLRLADLRDQGLIVETDMGVLAPGFRLVDLQYRDTGEGDDNAQHVETLVRQTRRDLLSHALGAPRAVHLRFLGVPMSDERFRQWLHRLQELEREFAVEGAETDPWYFLTVAAYPQPVHK